MRFVAQALKVVAVVVALLLGAAQFVRPSRTNPSEVPSRSLEQHLAVPPEVGEILARACADCHSNRTEWPWYSRVAPASWLVAGHVNDGRRHLNFSEWSRHGPRESADLLRHICHEARVGTMPLDSYTLLHPRARLSPRDVQTLCDWTANSGAR